MMFAYTSSHWLTFLSTVLLLNLCPGPDMALILGHTLRGGRFSGFTVMFGTWVGAFSHVLMASVGITTILASSPLVFSILKGIGATYLIILGVQTLKQQTKNLNVDNVNSNTLRFWTIFQQGFLSNLLNPKAAIFILAFLPQFAIPDLGSIPIQVLLHGILLILLSGAIMGSLVLCGDYLSESILSGQKFTIIFYRSFGVLLIMFGISFGFASNYGVKIL